VEEAPMLQEETFDVFTVPVTVATQTESFSLFEGDQDNPLITSRNLHEHLAILYTLQDADLTSVNMGIAQYQTEEEFERIHALKLKSSGWEKTNHFGHLLFVRDAGKSFRWRSANNIIVDIRCTTTTVEQCQELFTYYVEQFPIIDSYQ
jgi:hypothetical protein